MVRKIAVVTGSRAEYGLLYPLIKMIEHDHELLLQLVVTGMHLSPEFGYTCNEIVQDGFRVDEKVEMLLSSDTNVGITKSMGLGLIGFADVWERLKPDIVVVLGDRYEIMVAVQAAMIANIPIAHLHGGESTEGLVDEAIRHSITKMSHLHFVSNEKYRTRVMQLGEAPAWIFNVGALGLDNIRNHESVSRKEFEESIDFKLGELSFLVTYHPVTLHQWGSKRLLQELFAALDEFSEARVVFTKPNADADGRIIAQMIDEYVGRNKERMIAHTSLGKNRYLNALHHLDVVIGNSSSGIIEAPIFKKPTINIGDRQKGRASGSTVIHCSDLADDIIAAIQLALSKEFYQNNLKNAVSLYGDGHASNQIIDVIKNVNLNELLQKSFYEVGIK